MDAGESPGDGAPGGPGGRRSSSFRRYAVAPCRFSSAGRQGTDCRVPGPLLPFTKSRWFLFQVSYFPLLLNAGGV